MQRDYGSGLRSGTVEGNVRLESQGFYYGA